MIDARQKCTLWPVMHIYARSIIVFRYTVIFLTNDSMTDRMRLFNSEKVLIEKYRCLKAVNALDISEPARALIPHWRLRSAPLACWLHPDTLTGRMFFLLVASARLDVFERGYMMLRDGAV